MNTKSWIEQRTDAAVEGLVVAQARIATVAPDAYERSWDHGVREVVLGAPYSALNVLFCTAAEVDLDVLAAGADHLEGAGVPWSIRVRASAAEAVTELAAGYGHTSRLTMPVMGKQLDQSDAAPVPGARRVNGDDSASYLGTLAEGFECPPALFGRLCEPAVLDQRLMRAFLVESQGAPVATALGVQAGDIAAVFNIAVPPRFRGHGYGRAATAAVLSDAYTSGAQTAVLASSAMGFGMYRLMGFEEIDAWAVFEPGLS